MKGVAVDGRLVCRLASWRLDSGSGVVFEGLFEGGGVDQVDSTATGRTYALDARTGILRWVWRDGQYTPVTADNRGLYLVGYSKLYAMVPE